jgi:hypothetical protein
MLPNSYLMTLLEPENYMSGIPDPLSLFPLTRERIKTQFVVAPDNSGDICVYGTGMKNGFVIQAGTAVFDGTTYYNGGPAGNSFSPYNWDSFDRSVSGGAAAAGRLVASKWIAEYIGSPNDGSGRLTCCQFPANFGTNPIYYDGIASYDYSYDGPVLDGCHQIALPTDASHATSFRDTSGVYASNVLGQVAIYATGLTGGGVPPAGDDRINITIYQVYEFLSVNPILTGRQVTANTRVAEVAHAGNVLTQARVSNKLNGNKHGADSTIDKIGKWWMDHTWGQRDYMWGLTKEYGPKIAEWLAVNVAAGL